MGKLITNMEGNQYGNWLVLKENIDRDKHGNQLCLCECQCENNTIKLVKGYDLRAGRSKSCGCINKN